MRTRTSQLLYSYWNEVRGSRLDPRRFEIEPSRIASVLPETFILERTDFETYRFRLAGTRICEQVGAELRGSDFLEGWTPEDRLTLERSLLSISQQGGVLTVEIVATGREPSRQVSFELMMLPLMHLLPTADRFLGSWCALDAPSWLGAERLTSCAITDCEIVWPDGRPHAVVERQERQVPFLPHVRSSRLVRVDRRQFRVYDGGLIDSEGGEK